MSSCVHHDEFSCSGCICEGGGIVPTSQASGEAFLELSVIVNHSGIMAFPCNCALVFCE
jgi:hypothetical protein